MTARNTIVFFYTILGAALLVLWTVLHAPTYWLLVSGGSFFLLAVVYAQLSKPRRPL